MKQLPAEIRRFMDIFSDKGYRIYVVGGAVRNLLLGLDVINWDFTTNAKPEELKALFPDSFYNNTFGTVGIKFEGHILEVTTHRKESDYTDSRHPDTIEWAETIEEDLARRDFTINAIAFHFVDGEIAIVDPYAGQSDLEKKRIVTVGDPDKRFAEDALRLMRAVRLTAELGFLLDDATRDSMRKNAMLINKVSGERIRDELLRIISSDNPAEGILFLRSTGILEQILPELDACFTIEQKAPSAIIFMMWELT
ncbi:MAG: CCA tRNA nucleotidyltransferase [Rhodocyclaceae bacterium]|nr:CCA tRNA nucleotidyltransferase [Rhodocyclaceae bacterium]